MFAGFGGGVDFFWASSIASFFFWASRTILSSLGLRGAEELAGRETTRTLLLERGLQSVDLARATRDLISDWRDLSMGIEVALLLAAIWVVVSFFP